MRIHEIISEAIPIEKYKKIIRSVNVDYKSRYDNLFNGEMRLYFPLKNGKGVTDALGKHREAQEEDSKRALIDCLTRHGFSNINFETKTVFDKHGRRVKMGKAIASSIAALQKKYPDSHFTRYIQAFRQWERENQLANKELQAKVSETEQLMVVISRHPYDVAGMSTGREWSSCLDLEKGGNAHYIPTEIKHGTLVAYLTSANDKNLNNPIGRVLIKPYFHVDTWGDKPRSPKDIMLGIEGRTYPPEAKNIPEWLGVVKKWITKANARINKGEYQMPVDLYNDQIQTRITK